MVACLNYGVGLLKSSANYMEKGILLSILTCPRGGRCGDISAYISKSLADGIDVQGPLFHLGGCEDGGHMTG